MRKYALLRRCTAGVTPETVRTCCGFKAKVYVHHTCTSLWRCSSSLFLSSAFLFFTYTCFNRSHSTRVIQRYSRQHSTSTRETAVDYMYKDDAAQSHSKLTFSLHFLSDFRWARSSFWRRIFFNSSVAVVARCVEGRAPGIPTSANSNEFK